MRAPDPGKGPSVRGSAPAGSESIAQSPPLPCSTPRTHPGAHQGSTWRSTRTHPGPSGRIRGYFAGPGPPLPHARAPQWLHGARAGSSVGPACKAGRTRQLWRPVGLVGRHPLSAAPPAPRNFLVAGKPPQWLVALARPRPPPPRVGGPRSARRRPQLGLGGRTGLPAAGRSDGWCSATRELLVNVCLS